MLKLERELRKYPEYENGREADIILGMANKPLLVSADKDSDLKSLSSGGVGMCKEENHVLKRNIITNIIQVIKNQNEKNMG
jgi:hypothetical protein